MTRRQALQEAYKIIEQFDMDNDRKADILQLICDCRDDLPFTHWTQKSILDACQQFLIDYKTDILRTSDFDHYRTLPPHPVIKLHFHMTAKEFRDAYFPLPYRDVYGHKTNKEWLGVFKSEYKRIQPASGNEYNRNRDKTTPTWNTIAKRNGIHTWLKLLEECRCSKECHIQKLTYNVSRSHCI